MNWLLLNLGDAAQWLGHMFMVCCGAVGHALDVILNPVLAPVLRVLNPVCTTLTDAVYALLAPLPGWLALMLLSVVIGVLALIAFRYTSNQAAIGRWRDRMTAHLLTLWLFKDDLRVGLRAQRRLFGALARWQWHMLRPFAILIILLFPLFSQMAARYQWRPLRPGEQAVLRVRLAPTDAVPAVTLAPSPGVTEAVGPVSGSNELVWRITAGAPGRHMLRLDVDGKPVEKELVIGSPLQRVSAQRPAVHWTGQLLYPVEPPLPAGGPLAGIEISYPGEASYLTGPDWWIVHLLVVSMLAACACLPFFKVRL